MSAIDKLKNRFRSGNTLAIIKREEFEKIEQELSDAREQIAEMQKELYAKAVQLKARESECATLLQKHDKLFDDSVAKISELESQLKASEADAIRKAANAIYEDMREVTASEHHPILSIFRAKLEQYASSIERGEE